MRHLATIQKIKDIAPIENADAIEVATVLGWRCVVKKGEFSVGDQIVYFEIDSILPPNDAYAFLEKYHWKIRTVKLRGQISQGLILSTDILPEGEYQEGDDVTEVLGVTKYEPVSFKSGRTHPFPSFIPKTDSERIQNLEWIFEEFPIVFHAHEKLDGTSCTVYCKDGKVGVCSRNMEVEDDGVVYWAVAKKYGLDEALPKMGINIAVQMEIIGDGIQKNKYNLKEKKAYVYDVYDIDTGRYLDLPLASSIAKVLGLPWVPYVGDFDLTNHNVDSLLSVAEGKSALNPGSEREGLVFRPAMHIWHPKLDRVGFKAISNKFLLKYEN